MNTINQINDNAVQNVGNKNVGNKNVGYANIGNGNVGNDNVGNNNVGNNNVGNNNVGYVNIGNGNVGNDNVGNGNVGDWNKTDGAVGYFNTTQQRMLMYMFNKPSDWTYLDWEKSEAATIFADLSGMREDYRQAWWNRLSEEDKATVKKLPNFDANIFYEITGITV